MKSMTGFASVDGPLGGLGDAAAARWRWDARSVNNRGLEIRLRAPSGWEGCEAALRAQAASRFKRGSISLTLAVSEPATIRAVRLNRDMLDQAIAAARTIRGRLDPVDRDRATLSIDGLMGLKGVLETEAPIGASGPSEEEVAAVQAGLERALTDLEVARGEEGSRLAALFLSLIDQIDALVSQAETQADLRADAMRLRLRERVTAVLEAGADIDEARLAQELALLVVKADIREEIDRLRSHIAGARALLASDEPIGRKLDFLTQEFNREANTLCAKSQDAALTETGLALKVLIDQMREQASNVE